MTTATFTQTNFSAQDPTTYRTAIDGNCMLGTNIIDNFACHAQATPNMTVRVDAGLIPTVGAVPVVTAAQSSGTLTAPTTNPRHDIVTITPAGAIAIVTGTEAATPTDPAIVAVNMPVARLAMTVGMVSITNSIITDLRTHLDAAWANNNYLPMAPLASGMFIKANTPGGVVNNLLGTSGSGQVILGDMGNGVFVTTQGGMVCPVNMGNATDASHAVTKAQSSVGMVYTVVTASRVLGTTYTNTTARSMLVLAGGSSAAELVTLKSFVNGVEVTVSNAAINFCATTSFLVPPGSTYELTLDGAGASIILWSEAS